MTEKAPAGKVYILHGDDEYSMSRKVEELLKPFDEMNITRLNGAQASAEELRTAAYTMPFLAAGRAVVLLNPLAKLTAKDAHKPFLEFLASIPETTTLILVIDDYYKNVPINGNWQKVWQVMTAKHWLKEWANAAGSRVNLREYFMPVRNEMIRWILSQAEAAGGAFDSEAASKLAEYVGGETRVASLEIHKLLTYVDYARPVTIEDVERLTPYANPPNIFDMVDAMAAGNPSQAQKVFRQLLEEDEAAQIFQMVVRQYRLLLQGREILDEGGDQKQALKEIAEATSGYVAKKALDQARRFRQQDLEAIYHRLLELDVAVKSGEISYELGIEMMIAGIRS